MLKEMFTELARGLVGFGGAAVSRGLVGNDATQRNSATVSISTYRVQVVFPCSPGGNGQAFKGATRLSSGFLHPALARGE
jgi:hypothetical protein